MYCQYYSTTVVRRGHPFGRESQVSPHMHGRFICTQVHCILSSLLCMRFRIKSFADERRLMPTRLWLYQIVLKNTQAAVISAVARQSQSSPFWFMRRWRHAYQSPDVSTWWLAKKELKQSLTMPDGDSLGFLGQFTFWNHAELEMLQSPITLMMPCPSIVSLWCTILMIICLSFCPSSVHKLFAHDFLRYKWLGALRFSNDIDTVGSNFFWLID